MGEAGETACACTWECLVSSSICAILDSQPPAPTPQKYLMHLNVPSQNKEEQEQLLSHKNVHCWEFAALHFKQVSFAALVT